MRRILPSGARTGTAALLTATLTAALALLLPASAPATPAAPAAPANHHPAPTVSVTGAVAHPLTLTTAQLRRYGTHRVHAWYATSSGTEEHTFDGPRLLDVLTAAVPAFDPKVKNDSLGFAVLVTGTDGYRAVVSWGEIDPGFAGNQVLLAYQQDRDRLDRPRLVLPQDAKGGRYVSDIATITVVAVGR